ncbi:MAG TPA: type II toxin-antitoxin system prevent-host-death family antitoxin [Vicinamibacterales bacterium]|nr:type II toxin-antitoxin system prevent-host-death family antitoxin [Vicinamibacterales bacterium]
MRSIGVRELRQRASEFLRRVEQGETIEVTDRGRRVAILSPPPEGTPLDRLRALGDVEAANGDLDDLPEPLVLAPGYERPSEVLDRLRKHER